jgi:hypothetical protein
MQTRLLHEQPEPRSVSCLGSGPPAFNRKYRGERLEISHRRQYPTITSRLDDVLHTAIAMAFNVVLVE